MLVQKVFCQETLSATKPAGGMFATEMPTTKKAGFCRTSPVPKWIVSQLDSQQELLSQIAVTQRDCFENSCLSTGRNRVARSQIGNR